MKRDYGWVYETNKITKTESFVDQFNEYSQKIRADYEEMSKYHTKFRELMKLFLKDEFGDVENFLIGSYARNTAVKPIGDIGHDIDIAFVFKKEKSAKEIIERLIKKCDANILKAFFKDSSYISKMKEVRIQKKSIGVKFEDVDFDIVPLFQRDKDGYTIFYTDGEEWAKTDPKEHKKIGEQIRNKFVHANSVIRFVKYWNNSWHKCLSSLWIELFLYESMSKLTEKIGTSSCKELLLECLSCLYEGIKENPKVICDPGNSSNKINCWKDSERKEMKEQLKSLQDAYILEKFNLGQLFWSDLLKKLGLSP
eukprot:gene1089-10608_t